MTASRVSYVAKLKIIVPGWMYGGGMTGQLSSSNAHVHTHASHLVIPLTGAYFTTGNAPDVCPTSM